jgi:hydrogenase maturation protein HypF
MSTSLIAPQDREINVRTAERHMTDAAIRVAVRGAVQGVGFRPFVFRLARELHLKGWVGNTPEGVLLEMEGESEQLDSLLQRIQTELPPSAVLHAVDTSPIGIKGYRGLEIRESAVSGDTTAIIQPDLAACRHCLSEMYDPRDRRFRYPFTNCTHCGPRFSIIEGLPYDRPRTSMRKFVMCPRCRDEYESPADRRFHAQPIACPACGPQLSLWNEHGVVLAEREEALEHAVRELRNGRIVALKGLGGFHLMVDARDAAAVRRLRRRKERDEKPFAVMVPSLNWARGLCEVSEREECLLTDPAAPIVLLRRRDEEASSLESVAPGNPCLGLMLPYTPLHHLLMDAVAFPVVATSGNRSDEPICIDEHEALEHLRGIADVFLVHDRPIVRRVDDSVVRLLHGEPQILRRARGYAPLPIMLPDVTDDTARDLILAVGAHQKNAVALARGRQVFVSQHIGDLENVPALASFEEVISSFEKTYGPPDGLIACDRHPDYLSSVYARRRTPDVLAVQHHHAHVLACMAEHGLQGPALGVAWDGTGFGLDGTIWGGEFLRITSDGFEREACLLPFRLPGGDAAARDARRSAAGLLHAVLGPDGYDLAPEHFRAALPRNEYALLLRMMERGINAPLTSSVGRLFDGVAALLGIRGMSSFEGQAAMDLEFAVAGRAPAPPYSFDVTEGPLERPDLSATPRRHVDWRPMLREILDDIRLGTDVGTIARRFHETLVAIIVRLATALAEDRVILTGGCFQNRYLSERAAEALTDSGFRPFWHRQVPPNDGGICLGQVFAARRRSTIRPREEPCASPFPV